MRARTLALVLALLGACKGHDSAPAPAPPGPAPHVPSPTPTPAAPMLPMPGDTAALATASNTFAFELWASMRTVHAIPGLNVAISPASISIALAMTWGGAKGDTAAQMQKTLHVSGTPDAVVTSWGGLSRALQDPAHHRELRIANRLFGDQSYHFLPAYLDLTQAAFGAPLAIVDFRGNPGGAQGTINGWVVDQTEGKIMDLLPPGTITSATRLALVNAIYFLASWAEPFPESGTERADFMRAPGTPVRVSMMHTLSTFRVAHPDGVSVLELPYAGDASMLLVLPDAPFGLADVETGLDATKFAAWQAALQPQGVALALPRFQVNDPVALELSEQLGALGMTLPFDGTHADFTGIAAPPSPADRLHISAVFHKAFVKVEETGTEAAAATAVVMGPGGAPPPRAAMTLTFDHPFLFFIIDKQSGLILFMGRIVDASSG